MTDAEPTQIISFSEAKSIGQKWYFTGKPCNYGHVDKRWVCRKSCAECTRIRQRKYSARNRQRELERVKKWQYDKKNGIKREKISRKRNNDLFNKPKLSRFKRMSVEKIRHRYDIRNAWAKKNRARITAFDNSRKKIIRQRTPSWADRKKIRAVYEKCSRVTQETGISHHVDHIIPLQGKYVSGLHIHTNLQILPATENMKKKNHFTV